MVKKPIYPCYTCTTDNGACHLPEIDIVCPKMVKYEKDMQAHEGHFLDSEKILPNPSVQRLYNKSFMAPRDEN